MNRVFLLQYLVLFCRFFYSFTICSLRLSSVPPYFQRFLFALVHNPRFTSTTLRMLPNSIKKQTRVRNEIGNFPGRPHVSRITSKSVKKITHTRNAMVNRCVPTPNLMLRPMASFVYSHMWPVKTTFGRLFGYIDNGKPVSFWVRMCTTCVPYPHRR